MAPMVEFSVLGPVEAAVEGRTVALAAEKPRALLAILLLSRNRVVSVSHLIDELWGEAPPETAAKALQVYVSQLRKAIGADRVVTRPPGYSLRVDDGELDLDRFERLVHEGRELLAAGDAEPAAERLSGALELWRGPALAEFAAEPFARDAGARLEELRVAALEDRIDADLTLGRHAGLVSELEELVARNPFRERLRAQLMLALYRSGRQADALDAYRRTRETLVGELGIEPGAELQELERAILRQDRSLDVGRGERRAEQPYGRGPATRRPLAVGAAVAVALAAETPSCARSWSRSRTSWANRVRADATSRPRSEGHTSARSRPRRPRCASTVSSGIARACFSSSPQCPCRTTSGRCARSTSCRRRVTLPSPPTGATATGSVAACAAGLPIEARFERPRTQTPARRARSGSSSRRSIRSPGASASARGRRPSSSSPPLRAPPASGGRGGRALARLRAGAGASRRAAGAPQRGRRRFGPRVLRLEQEDDGTASSTRSTCSSVNAFSHTRSSSSVCAGRGMRTPRGGIRPYESVLERG